MSDKLRAAAQAALDLLDNDDRDCAFAAGILRVALAEPAIKESLTVRPWVGLTDDEIEYLRNDQPWWMVRDIEAKLREKNS